jgi:pimeloyl-ACP methyl ester carboxylesterase
VESLTARGVKSDAVELPFTGRADDVDVARAAIEAAGPGAVVCAHSLGGAIITEAASGMTDIGRLIYLAAFQLDRGEHAGTFLVDEPTPLLSAMETRSDSVVLDPSRLHDVLYGDSDPAVVEQIARKLRPMPRDETAGEGLSVEPAWRTIPSTYVICTNDYAIAPATQRMLAQRADEVIEWDTDHSPFLTRPEAIADVIATYC